jgi:flavin-dependent dehydrogenase
MTPHIYDTIIIGGGPAGSTTATTLAQLGHDVLVLEKNKFPRDHVGESLLPFCYQIFQDLKILDKMKTGFSRKPGVTFSNMNGSEASHWCFDQVIKDESYLSFHVHRAQFDELLLNNCRDHGVAVKEEVRVINVMFDHLPGIVQVKSENNNRQQISFLSRFVVDASGQDTLLAKQLNCKEAFESLNKRIAFSTHWSGANYNATLIAGNTEIVHLEGDKAGWLWMIPLKEDRLSIGVALNMEYAKARKKELSPLHENWQEVFYKMELNCSAVASEILKDASIINPIAVNGNFSYYASKKFGKQYAVVGDASAFLDPIFSSGIYLGMKGGQLVAEGISQLLKEGKNEQLSCAYKDISGAYRLVEKLINTFYNPNSIRFSQVTDERGFSYQKFKAAYSILHLILAGDFFTNYNRYMKAIEMLNDIEKIDQYENLVNHETKRGKDVFKSAE